MAKTKFPANGLVYSTDKDFKQEETPQEKITVSPGEQQLKIRLDTKHRGGKAVTIIDGYAGDDIAETGKKLKTFCGTGGSVKDGQIIVQGDNRDKVFQWLQKNGFKSIRKT
jgi:translation initiation factor 1